MIKANLENGKAVVEIEGRPTQILSELTVLVKSTLEQMAEETGMPKDFYNTAFMMGMHIF